MWSSLLGVRISLIEKGCANFLKGYYDQRRFLDMGDVNYYVGI